MTIYLRTEIGLSKADLNSAKPRAVRFDKFKTNEIVTNILLSIDTQLVSANHFAMTVITDPEDFFTVGCGRCDRFATPECSIHLWLDGLKYLRLILLGMGLEETVKWGHPCYMFAGRNIAILTALRDDFRLGFMNPSLLEDREGVLERQGPNSATPSMMRFTTDRQVAAMERVIRGYLQQLMDHAEAGTNPQRVEREIDMPDELIEALDADPELAEAFYALTPGRQKSYMFNLNQAKPSETRVTRIDKFRDKIIEGKGALER